MMKSLQRILYVGLLAGRSAVMADTIALRDDHPNVYYVKKGDSLWDISGRFLENPWQWPELWHDNPDIEKYMGNFELEVARPFGNHVIELMLRNNLRSENKGAARINYSFPLSKRFKGLVQGFSGYGDSLINYDNYENRYSFGILLTDSL